MFIPYRLLVSHMQNSTPEPYPSQAHACPTCGGTKFNINIMKGNAIIGNALAVMCANDSCKHEDGGRFHPEIVLTR